MGKYTEIAGIIIGIIILITGILVYISYNEIMGEVQSYHYNMDIDDIQSSYDRIYKSSSPMGWVSVLIFAIGLGCIIGMIIISIQRKKE